MTPRAQTGGGRGRRRARLRGWNTGLLDYILPKAPGGFQISMQEQNRLSVGSCGKPFAPVFSRRFS